jgi:hypothetical protein
MEVQERLENLEKEVEGIKERNKRAERDKAWEISWWRRGVITLLTYIVMVVYFYAADLPQPLINSVVPAVAFVLATMTLPWFQKLWEKLIYDPEEDRPHG